MAQVVFTRHLSRFFPSLTAGEVPGATVRELIDELERRHPGLASYIIDEAGRLRRHVNVFVGDACATASGSAIASRPTIASSSCGRSPAGNAKVHPARRLEALPDSHLGSAYRNTACHESCLVSFYRPQRSSIALGTCSTGDAFDGRPTDSQSTALKISSSVRRSVRTSGAMVHCASAVQSFSRTALLRPFSTFRISSPHPVLTSGVKRGRRSAVSVGVC